MVADDVEGFLFRNEVLISIILSEPKLRYVGLLRSGDSL